MQRIAEAIKKGRKIFDDLHNQNRKLLIKNKNDEYKQTIDHIKNTYSDVIDFLNNVTWKKLDLNVTNDDIILYDGEYLGIASDPDLMFAIAREIESARLGGIPIDELNNLTPIIKHCYNEKDFYMILVDHQTESRIYQLYDALDNIEDAYPLEVIGLNEPLCLYDLSEGDIDDINYILEKIRKRFSDIRREDIKS